MTKSKKYNLVTWAYISNKVSEPKILGKQIEQSGLDKLNS